MSFSLLNVSFIATALEILPIVYAFNLFLRFLSKAQPDMT